MKLALTIGAWIVSLGALAAAALTGYVAVHYGQLSFWLGVATCIGFALVANPLTGPRLGFAGAWRRTLAAQAALVVIGVGSLFAGFHFHGVEQRRELAEAAARAEQEAIVSRLRDAAQAGVDRAHRTAMDGNGIDLEQLSSLIVPEPEAGWREVLRSTPEDFTIERAAGCVEMLDELLHYSTRSSGAAQPTAFSFEEVANIGNLPTAAWRIPSTDQLVYGIAFWSAAKLHIAMRGASIFEASTIVNEADNARELAERALSEDVVSNRRVQSITQAVYANMGSELSGVPVWRWVREGEIGCLEPAGISPEPVNMRG